jgi:hypothetical protein
MYPLAFEIPMGFYVASVQVPGKPARILLEVALVTFGLDVADVVGATMIDSHLMSLVQTAL